MHYRENSVQIFFFRAGFIISFNSLVFCADSAPVPAQVSDTLPDILSGAHNTPDEKNDGRSSANRAAKVGMIS